MAKLLNNAVQQPPSQSQTTLYVTPTRKNEWADFQFRAQTFQGTIYFEKIENNITVKNFTRPAPLSEADLAQLRGNYIIAFGTESAIEEKKYWCEYGHQAIPEEKKPAPVDPEIERKLKEAEDLKARLAFYEKTMPPMQGMPMQQPTPAVDMFRIMEMMNQNNRMWEERFARLMERPQPAPQGDFNKEIMLALINKDTKSAEPPTSPVIQLMMDQLAREIAALRSPQSDPLRDKMLDVMIAKMEENKNPLQSILQMKNFLDEMKSGDAAAAPEKEGILEKAMGNLPAIVSDIASIYNQKAQTDIEKIKLDKQSELEKMRIEQENKQYEEQRKRETQVFERQLNQHINKTQQERLAMEKAYKERLSIVEQEARQAKQQNETYASTLDRLKVENTKNIHLIRNNERPAPPIQGAAPTPNPAAQGVFSQLLGQFIQFIPPKILEDHNYQQLLAQANDLVANPQAMGAHGEETIARIVDFMIDIDEHYDMAITGYLEENKNPDAAQLVVWARNELKVELPVGLVDKLLKDWYSREVDEVAEDGQEEYSEAESQLNENAPELAHAEGM